MRYRFCTAEQGSPEWLLDRAGCVTGSKADILYAKGKGSAESTQRINYRYQLAEERITGKVEMGGFKSAAMQHGNDEEAFARICYEGETFITSEQVGFLRLEDMYSGCSLDGVTRENGVVVGGQEFKCPMLKTHVAYIKDGQLPDDYKWQVIHNLWCLGTEWLDFMSYRNGFKPFLIRCHAKDLPIEEHDKTVRQFLTEVAEVENELMSYAV